jgi:hypothetical protein
MLLLYIGPESTVPLASALAAGIGIVLLLGGRAVRRVRGAIQRISSLFGKK